MENCVVLCKFKFEDGDGLGYEHHSTITLGPFMDHETAGQFMTEFMDNDEKVKSCIGGLYGKKIDRLIGWEVADLIPFDFLSSACSDHERAVRTSHQPQQTGY